jgi:hypothetical protein
MPSIPNDFIAKKTRKPVHYRNISRLGISSPRTLRLAGQVEMTSLGQRERGLSLMSLWMTTRRGLMLRRSSTNYRVCVGREAVLRGRRNAIYERGSGRCWRRVDHISYIVSRSLGALYCAYMSLLYSSNGKTHCIQGSNNDKVPKPKGKKRVWGARDNGR